MINKRGQFYIVAAIIIILAISGIIGVKTYATTKTKPRSLQSMSAELKEEGFQIINYGIWNDKNITKLMSNFTEEFYPNYFLKKTDNANVIVIYGNKTDLFGTQYKTVSTGTITATIGSGGVNWEITDAIINKTKIIPTGDSVVVTMLGRDYEFNLKDNEMFYFVIIQEKEGERYVEKS